MTKKVNVYPSGPVRGFSTPIVRPMMGTMLNSKEIIMCIYQRARVEEVLEDGTTVKLSFSNYNKDNSHKMKTKLDLATDIATTDDVIVSELEQDVEVEAISSDITTPPVDTDIEVANIADEGVIEDADTTIEDYGNSTTNHNNNNNNHKKGNRRH